MVVSIIDTLDLTIFVKSVRFIREVIENSLITIIMGAVAFALILVTTLNFTAATLVFVLFIFLAILQHSFSRGWLFLLVIALLLPSIGIGTSYFAIHEIFLTILAVIGLISIGIENKKIPINKISYYFFLLIIIGGSIIVFGSAFEQVIDPSVWILIVTLALIWALLIAFQYFFQTQKRLQRFFLALITVGVLHSAFGILAYIFDWQTSLGMGISSGKFEHLIFADASIRVNGFLGDGFVMRVGDSALAPLLLITIPVAIGLLLSFQKEKKSPAKKTFDTKRDRLFDSIHLARTKEELRRKIVVISQKTNVKDLQKELPMIFNKKTLIIGFILLQAVALILTFSYSALVILTIGLFAIGLLLRNKSLLSIAASILIVLSIAFPGFRSSLINESTANLTQWFSGFEQVSKSWAFGNGWRVELQEGESSGISAEHIYNSYLYIWNILGLAGLLVFLAMLVQYFIEIRNAYIRSDGWQRIWLIVILAVFIEFALLGLTNNALLFGPAALIFWLLYGAIQNLKKRKVEFGLTETKIF